MSKTDPYNYKWFVQIKAGYYMAGTQRFRTKKQADAFVRSWRAVNRVRTYADLPTVEKVKP